MSNKMDKAGARTPADIERRYGKSFAETLGIAEDARTTAEKALKAANDVDGNLDHEEIFNRLTNNGQIKCIREIDGQIYINASYINSGKMSADRLNIEELFAKDINMSGTFTHTVDAFLYPGEPELKALRDALRVSFPAPYDPLLDFNSDGVLDAVDLTICQKAVMGLYDLSTWSGAVKKPVTMTINLANSEKAILFSGVNMWGRDVESYVGVNFTSIKNPDTEQKLDDLIPSGVYSNGAYIGQDLGLMNGVGLVMIKDSDNPLHYWYGVYGCKDVNGGGYTIQKIANNVLTATGNEWGTITITGGSGYYNFYNMSKGIL